MLQVLEAVNIDGGYIVLDRLINIAHQIRQRLPF